MTSPGSFLPGDVLTADDLNAIGVWESYTPVLTQDVARTATINQADYVLINKLCIVNVDLTCTTTGSGTDVKVSLPLTGKTSGTSSYIGSGLFYDSSATNNVLLGCSLLQSGTETAFIANSAAIQLQTTLGNNDVLSFSLVYETI